MEQMIKIITDQGSIAKLKNTVECYEKELIRVRKTSKELVGQVFRLIIYLTIYLRSCNCV